MFKDELIIIRHARSRHNIRHSEDLDDSISEFGERQARNVGCFFAEEVDLTGFQFYTSPLLRCLQTSEAISSRCGMEPIVMPQLREYLNHSGRAVEVINRKGIFPRMNWGVFPDEGEIYDEEFNEVFLHRMHEAHALLPNKSIVCTHGLPALVLLHVASSNTHSVPVWDHSIDNCSITIIRKGRVIWHGRNLYHEHEYDSKFYRRDWDGVVQREHP
jgi:broad specificity phosphatase PhoE